MLKILRKKRRYKDEYYSNTRIDDGQKMPYRQTTVTICERLGVKDIVVMDKA